MTPSQAIKLARTIADLSEPERVTVLAFARELGHTGSARPKPTRKKPRAVKPAAKPVEAAPVPAEPVKRKPGRPRKSPAEPLAATA